LLTASRLTGDASYREVAMRETGEERVAREVTALVEGKLDVEIPYGVGWVLILDTEAARNGIGLFRDLAYASRERLVGHLDRLTADGETADSALAAAACHEEYPNALWSAIALLRWGHMVGDAGAVDTATIRADAMIDAVRRHGFDDSAWPRRGFYSPVHLAVLLAADLGRDDAADLAGSIARDELLTATDMTTVHSAGLNFSRAWGVHAAWRILGDPAARETFASLVLGHAAMTDRWRDEYARYGHWVPQFGIFAIAESYRGQ
jgi:hypothetical protein